MLLPIDVEASTACEKLEVGFEGFVVKAYPVESRCRALLPVRLGSPGRRRIFVKAPKHSGRFDVEVAARLYPESILTVDPKFSKPPPPRAADESAAIQKAFRFSHEGRLWSDSFIRPREAIVTSVFGVRRTYNGKLASRHHGTDIDGAVGEQLVASNEGIVRLVAEDFYFVGNAVIIDHGDKLFTLYLHMSRVDVKNGDRVTRGQVIGAIGKTGRVTGPHVHFGVKVAGTYVDPESVWGIDPRRVLSEPTPVAVPSPYMAKP